MYTDTVIVIFTCGTLVGSALYFCVSKNATSPSPFITASANGVNPFYNRTILIINNFVTIIIGLTKSIIINNICNSYTFEKLLNQASTRLWLK